MVRCSRFLPALVIAFVYATIAPISILLRMGSSGWPWIINDAAFGFFMMVMFPFAVAVFSCVVDINLIRRALSELSPLTFPLILFGVMLIVLPRGVYLDLLDVNRLRQPYMFTDAAKVRELAALHAQAFKSKDLSKDLPKAVEQYKDREKAGDMRLSPAMAAVFFFSNLVNVAFSITVFCYIVLASVAGKIGADVCNHLVFVLAALGVWFPCRAYADWFINLNDFSWIASYAAAAVLLVLFIVGALVLALRMNEGSLYHRFVVPTGVISAVVGALAVWKSTWLSRTAMAFEGYDPIFRIALGLIVIGLLYYVSNTVHQRATVVSQT